MPGAEVIGRLVAQSDPANLALLAVVWWRLDRRIRHLDKRLEQSQDGEGP